MALIENANPKGNIKDSGYYRTIGDERLAGLMQSIQSTVITNGTELEHFHEAFVHIQFTKPNGQISHQKQEELLSHDLKFQILHQRCQTFLRNIIMEKIVSFLRLKFRKKNL